MEHWIEISRIIEGALRLDQEKVIAYTKHLCQKLREDGQIRYADKLEKLVSNPRTASLQPSSISALDRLPVDQDSRLPLGDIYTPDSISPSVIPSPAVEEAVHRFCEYIKHAANLELAGAPIKPSALLYGPPGYGKTETAHLIAKMLDLPIIVARLDSLVSSFLGNTAKNLRLLFDYARKRPCVLFLDEFDSLAKLRDDRNELGELKRVVNSLLQNIDSLDDGTILLAATNHPSLLDPAVWRRFYFRISIDKPDHATLVRIISHYLGAATSTFQGDDFAALASLFRDTSPSDIRDICQDAIRIAVLSNSTITPWCVIESYFRFRELAGQPGLSRDQVIQELHALEPKEFSVTRLHELTGLSKSTISRVTRKGGKDDGPTQ